MTADRIKLFNWPGPNGAKVQIALFETGLPHETEWIDIEAGGTKTPEFRARMPLPQIPAITDPKGPDGTPITLSESNAILLYLADKTGLLMPDGRAARHEAVQWLMWQVSAQGPVFGRLMWLLRGPGRDMTDRRVHDDMIARGRQVVRTLDRRLDGRNWTIGNDFSVVDVALWPWFRNLRRFLGDVEELEFDQSANVGRWFEAVGARPSVAHTYSRFRDMMRARKAE